MSDNTAGNNVQPKKSKGMIIGLIVGGVLLLTCCCTGGVGGFAVYFYVLPKAHEVAILGGWREDGVTFDFRKDGKLKRDGFDLTYKFIDAKTIEIGPDKQGKNTLNDRPYPTSRYRVEFKGDTLNLSEIGPAP